MNNIFKLEISKSGAPCLWERGGALTNTGESVIIMDAIGSPKRSIFVRTGGERANKTHALIPVRVGDHIIYVNRKREDYQISIYRITAVNTLIEKLEYDLIHYFDRGEWDTQPPKWWLSAINKAKEKSNCRHCREPHYIKEKTK